MITEVESISHEQEGRINIRVLITILLKVCRRSLTCHAMTTLQSHQFIEFSVVGAYHATLNGGHVMTEVKTERRRNRFTTTFLTIRSLYTMRFTHIFQDQSIRKDLTNFFNRCRQTNQVSNENCFDIRMLLSNILHLINIKREVTKIDVTEDRLQSCLNHRCNVGHPCGGRNKNFVTIFQTIILFDRFNDQRVGSATTRHIQRMLYTQPLRPLILKLTNLWSISKSTSGQNKRCHLQTIFECDRVLHQRPIHHLFSNLKYS